MKIFLVDDEQITNFITKRLLKQTGLTLEVIEFTDSNDAYTAIKSDNPDLILLDLSMPRFGGIDFLTKMQKDGITNKVAVLSSSISNMDREKVFKFPNVIEYLEKPTQKETLISCIERVTKG